MAETNSLFAPQLAIPGGIKDISFYLKAFGATQINVWKDDDSNIHVAELSIDGAVFHLHQQNSDKNFLEPMNNSISVIIGLFVGDVDEVTSNAVKAGAKLLSAPQDYDYGYRQSEIKDPFGHIWLIQKKI
jgi:PhnB protein